MFELNAVRGAFLTICYVLLDGVNDGDHDLTRLAALMRDRNACVEVKIYNPVTSSRYRPSPPGRARAFQRGLTDAGVAAYVFGNEGQRIDAGCGQLVWARAE